MDRASPWPSRAKGSARSASASRRRRHSRTPRRPSAASGPHRRVRRRECRVLPTMRCRDIVLKRGPVKWMAGRLPGRRRDPGPGSASARRTGAPAPTSPASTKPAPANWPRGEGCRGQQSANQSVHDDPPKTSPAVTLVYLTGGQVRHQYDGRSKGRAVETPIRSRSPPRGSCGRRAPCRRAST